MARLSSSYIAGEWYQVAGRALTGALVPSDSAFLPSPNHEDIILGTQGVDVKQVTRTDSKLNAECLAMVVASESFYRNKGIPYCTCILEPDGTLHRCAIME